MTPTLDSLRDLHLPPPPGFWPPAPGWWIAAGVLLIAALVLLRRHLRRRPLRAALRDLDALTADHRRDADPVRLAGGLSQLLRHYALQRFPQAGVAGLSGPRWLQFLDEHGTGDLGNDFIDGVGAVLVSLPYRASPAADLPAPDAVELIALVRRWLRANAP